MTDRELLELAAKAAGYEISDMYNERYFPANCKPDAKIPSLLVWNLGAWNPLTDDGDAIRLVVKLGMSVSSGTYKVACEFIPQEEDSQNICTIEQYGDDPYAATRRTIVRAAAEIGKGIE